MMGMQLLARAVLDDRDKDLRATLVQTQHGRLASGSSSTLAAHPAWTEVAFVDLDLARERAATLRAPSATIRSRQRVKSRCTVR